MFVWKKQKVCTVENTVLSWCISLFVITKLFVFNINSNNENIYVKKHSALKKSNFAMNLKIQNKLFVEFVLQNENKWLLLK